MGNMPQIFKRFYSQYNNNVIQKTYSSMSQYSLFSEIYNTVPFVVEIRMKKDVFAMQLNTESIVSMELMTIIGFFFERYSEERNCVWTKDKGKIKKFFRSGVSQFIKFGGRINLSLSEDSVCNLIDILTDKRVDDEIRTKMIENFKVLEEKNWKEFEEYVGELFFEEQETKHIEAATCMDLPMDWTNVFANDPRASGVIADSPADGLVLSLNNLGVVDIEYISQITGTDYKNIISALRGSIYQNPDTWNECFYLGWETADEYLSGRVVEKLKTARKANEKYRGYFSENVDALEKVIPAKVSTNDVYITLGSPWVPTDIIDEFIAYIFHDYKYTYNSDYAILHDEMTGTWKIPKKNRFSKSFIAENTYGTKRINALHILEKTLNMKPVFVTDEVNSSGSTGKKRVINKTETLLVLEKQKKLVEDFKNWVWKDLRRTNRLKQIYDEKYCSNVIRRFDGGFLQFPEMNPSVKLYDYQKNAVARIMFSANTLLAHDVGAGKTFEMIAAGMEMRRIGISKKNLYVVPNNLTGQWKDMFLKLYSKANILCIEPENFKKEKRNEILEDIRDNDYDGIIIAYSSFELIPISKEYYCEELRKELNELSNGKSKINGSQKRRKAMLRVMLDKIKTEVADENILSFDELGINTMFVDEAHNFKNVPIQTKIDNVLGISSSGSLKCQDMMDKVRAIQKANDGGGIVFATGTPISNSLTDIFIMQKYLQSGELTLLGLQSFDSWIGMFAEQSSEFEIDVDASNFRMATRFTKFHNMPELSNLLASIADFYRVDATNGIPQISEYRDVVISKTPEFEQYLKDISQRADNVRKRKVSPADDNMLKITTDGRKAALDIRLVDNNAKFNYQCKAMHCAENVFNIYHKMSSNNVTQLIFCDTSIPKPTFNLYDELKRLLTSMGVPAECIAFIHDATSEKKREELFEKVRRGEIRILIGSTFKLGLGVNVQDKLFALHHLDVPWRPSDMIQREGRILRKGNTNNSVDIYRYIAEGSFDAYSWQILESKQRMISAILSGCMTERMCEEIADTILSYAEVKAISVGNPLLKKRVELANDLSRALTLQKRMIETKQEIEIELTEIPYRIKHQKMLVEKCTLDSEYCSKNQFEYNKEQKKEIRANIFDAIVQNDLTTKETTVCNYRGFDIVIPSNMLKEKPFVYLQREGRYRVELSLSKMGIMARIDNFIESIDEHLNNLTDGLDKLVDREFQMQNELKKKDSYSDTIEKIKDELKRLDKELGVEKG